MSPAGAGLTAREDAGEIRGAVTGLSVTAVKGMQIRRVEEIVLERLGARGDRAFFVIDDRNRMVNGKHLGVLQTVVASFDESAGTLRLEFPDGSVIDGPIADDGVVTARFYSTMRDASLVAGPWAQALSELAGQPLRLARGPAIDRGIDAGASLISRASLDRLAEEGGLDGIDARRFRMLIEIDGVPAHAEDDWRGRDVHVGEAVIRIKGHVGRCLITSRDPESGVVDLPTLDLLGRYRRELETTEPLAFGVYAAVLQEGRVQVGDPVALSSRP